jgi:hypothetical protein
MVPLTQLKVTLVAPERPVPLVVTTALTEVDGGLTRSMIGSTSPWPLSMTSQRPSQSPPSPASCSTC